MPLDRNAKARILVFVRAYNTRMREKGQHTGPIPRAFMDVLRARLYGFHNSRDGRCYPSYERIAVSANCCRATVYAAIKALEMAGVLTWVHRLTKIRIPERDLFGQIVSRWQVIRTSNAYRFHDPQSAVQVPTGHKSENQPRPMNQESLSFIPLPTPTRIVVLHPHEALDSVLIKLGKAMGADMETIAQDRE